jgi:ATP-dependent exoDNAse (exonuclease V) beta subunit
VGSAVYEVLKQVPQELISVNSNETSQVQKSPFIWNSQVQISKKSVTELVEDSKEPHKNSSFQPVQALKKAHLGTQVHRFFEALTFDQRMAVPEDWKGAVDYVLNLKIPPMSEILKSGRAEWGFAYRKNNEIIQGAIDLWAELNDAVYILDYKTGSSDHSEMAINQLKVYAQALRDMKIVKSKKPQILVALYPFEKKLKKIELDSID